MISFANFIMSSIFIIFIWILYYYIGFEKTALISISFIVFLICGIREESDAYQDKKKELLKNKKDGKQDNESKGEN